MMRIGLAVDHGGFALKETVLRYLARDQHEVCDYGAYVYDAQDDYPDCVFPMCQAVASGEVERGIAICGSGIGASVAANKEAGVRAGLIVDCFSSHQGVEDDHMNVICLGARVLGPALACDLLGIFLAARPAQSERFLRRLQKISDWERGTSPQTLGRAA